VRVRVSSGDRTVIRASAMQASIEFDQTVDKRCALDAFLQ
jgi:hypothetical protein